MPTIHLCAYQLEILYTEILAAALYGSKNICLLSNDFQERNAFLRC